jgi:hypothetical protein
MRAPTQLPIAADRAQPVAKTNRTQEPDGPPADPPPPADFNAEAMPILATHWFGLLADERQAA